MNVKMLAVVFLVAGIALLLIPYFSKGGEVTIPGEKNKIECLVSIRQDFFGFASISGLECSKTMNSCSVILGQLFPASIFGAVGNVRMTLPSGESTSEGFDFGVGRDTETRTLSICTPENSPYVNVDIIDKSFKVRDSERWDFA